MLKKFTNKKGFTLMEMLIVVAIIAVLVAIAIPTMTNQLEKSREATDAANLRAAYAECSVAMVNDTTGAKGFSKAINPVQTEAGFKTLDADASIGNFKLSSVTSIKKGTPIYVNYAADGTCNIGSSKTADYKDVP